MSSAAQTLKVGVVGAGPPGLEWKTNFTHTHTRTDTHQHRVEDEE